MSKIFQYLRKIDKPTIDSDILEVPFPFMKERDLLALLQLDPEILDTNLIQKINDYLEAYNYQIQDFVETVCQKLEKQVKDREYSNSSSLNVKAREEDPLEIESNNNSEMDEDGNDLENFLAIGQRKMAYTKEDQYIMWGGDWSSYIVPLIGTDLPCLKKPDKEIIELSSTFGEEILPEMTAMHLSQKELTLDYGLKEEEQRSLNLARKARDAKEMKLYATGIKRRIKKMKDKEIEQMWELDLQRFTTNQKHLNNESWSLSKTLKTFSSYPWKSHQDLYKLVKNNRQQTKGSEIVSARVYKPSKDQKIPVNTEVFLSKCYGTSGLLSSTSVTGKWEDEYKTEYLKKALDSKVSNELWENWYIKTMK